MGRGGGGTRCSVTPKSPRQNGVKVAEGGELTQVYMEEERGWVDRLARNVCLL